MISHVVGEVLRLKEPDLVDFLRQVKYLFNV
jgi:phage antirepressor YoqD-like protein